MKDKKKLLKALTMTSILLMQGFKGQVEAKDYNEDYLEYKIDQQIDSKGFTTANVNFRIGPGTDYDSMVVLKEGTIVNVLSKMDNDWYLIEYNDMVGYISSMYINIIDMKEIEKQVMMLPTSYKVLTATTELNVREKSSANSKKCGTLKKGENVIYSNKLENGWNECIYNNKTCYVYGDYVNESYTINGECKKIVYFKNNADIYDYPYGNITTSMPKHEIAKVYGEVNNYYYVECEGNIGYIKKSDCKNLDDTYIIVDISSQKMILFNDMEILLASSVVTGKEKTPTDLGCYAISSKQKNRTLIGVDYKTFVKYWMGFNKGEGFHDASWRKKFGGEIYIKKGSHGCVNLPENIAKQLYEKVSIGDKVLIKK